MEIVISFHLNIYPEVELLDYRIVLVLMFWGNFILFSTVAVPLFFISFMAFF